jgi:hypothetical protein
MLLARMGVMRRVSEQGSFLGKDESMVASSFADRPERGASHGTAMVPPRLLGRRQRSASSIALALHLSVAQ